MIRALPRADGPKSSAYRVDAWLAAIGAHRFDPALRARLVRRAAQPGVVWRLGRYAVLEEIAHGGMSVVYGGWDPAILRPLALKVLWMGDLPDEEREEAELRFRKEVQTLGRLQHRSIPAVHDFATEGDLWFTAMERIDGVSLAESLQPGPLPPEQALAVGIQLAEALQVAHDAGIIHRDVKPANVLLARDRVVLLDFGIAKGPETGLTRADQLLGTPRYLAPERLSEKDVAIDGRADLFSLGVLLFVCLTGRMPFDGTDTSEILDGILRKAPAEYRDSGPQGAAIARVLQRLLAKRPADRFPDGRSVAEALRAISHREGGTSEAAPGGPLGGEPQGLSTRVGPPLSGSDVPEDPTRIEPVLGDPTPPAVWIPRPNPTASVPMDQLPRGAGVRVEVRESKHPVRWWAGGAAGLLGLGLAAAVFSAMQPPAEVRSGKALPSQVRPKSGPQRPTPPVPAVQPSDDGSNADSAKAFSAGSWGPPADHWDSRCRRIWSEGPARSGPSLEALRDLVERAPRSSCAHHALARRLEPVDPRAAARHYRSALSLADPEGIAARELRRALRGLKRASGPDPAK